MAGQLDKFAPLANPLPPPPDGEVFTEDQWATLLALADTYIQSITDASADENSLTHHGIPEEQYNKARDIGLVSIPNDAPFSSKDEAEKSVRGFFAESASSLPGFKETLKRVFGHYVHEEGRKGITFILTALK